MITTKAISAKIDAYLLQKLDEECYFHGKKRNRVINDAVEHYLKHLDKVREDNYWKNMPQGRVDERYHALGKYILNNLTGEQHAYIKFSAQGVGCTQEHLMYRLIVGALEDFKKRPFSYL